MQNPDSHYFESAGLRLHYATWGEQDAPPLLLIHGGFDHCRNWDWTANALADRFRIIAPDLRGHGESEWARGNSYSMADYVYDVVELVRHLALESFAVIGHSLGGAIITKYMGCYPETVNKGVIIEGLVPPGEIKSATGENPAERMRTWVTKRQRVASRPHRAYATQEEAIDRMQSSNSHLTPERACHLAIHGSRQNADGSYSWKFDPMLRASQRFDMTPEQSCLLWQQIDCPVLLLRGEDSWASDPGKDGRVKHFKDARVVNFADAGHWLHHDQFERFIEVVDEFL